MFFQVVRQLTLLNWGGGKEWLSLEFLDPCNSVTFFPFCELYWLTLSQCVLIVRPTDRHGHSKYYLFHELKEVLGCELAIEIVKLSAKSSNYIINTMRGPR